VTRGLWGAPGGVGQECGAGLAGGVATETADDLFLGQDRERDGLPGYQTPAETADRVQPATVDAAVRAVVDTVLVGRSLLAVPEYARLRPQDREVASPEVLAGRRDDRDAVLRSAARRSGSWSRNLYR